MPEDSTLKELSAIDSRVSARLQNRDFRREWFRAELEDSVPAAYRVLRERRSLTQSALAQTIGTKQPAISRFEKSSEPVWEFAFLLRLAEALDARLRLVVEASEDIIGEYEKEAEEAQPSHALAKLALNPLAQRADTSALESLGTRNEANKYRGQSHRLAFGAETDQGAAVRAGRLGGSHPAVSVSALSR